MVEHPREDGPARKTTCKAVDHAEIVNEAWPLRAAEEDFLLYFELLASDKEALAHGKRRASSLQEPAALPAKKRKETTSDTGSASLTDSSTSRSSIERPATPPLAIDSVDSVVSVVCNDECQYASVGFVRPDRISNSTELASHKGTAKLRTKGVPAGYESFHGPSVDGHDLSDSPDANVDLDEAHAGPQLPCEACEVQWYPSPFLEEESHEFIVDDVSRRTELIGREEIARIKRAAETFFLALRCSRMHFHST